MLSLNFQDVDSVQFGRPAQLAGVVTVPGDKSISHRALLLAALADGTSEIIGLSSGHDVLATVRCLRQLGIDCENTDTAKGVWRVHGRPLAQWVSPTAPLDCGNSGTTMRLLCGVLAAAPRLRATLTGDRSLLQRPMLRVAQPLRTLGAHIDLQANGSAPIVITGQQLAGGYLELAVASAQIKSAVLLAGLHASAPVRVTEPMATRDHSERMLTAMGAQLMMAPNTITVGPGALRPLTAYSVAGDPSAAAFAVALAVLHPRAALAVGEVSTNPGRSGYLSILQRMGASVRSTSPALPPMAEPRGRIDAQSSSVVAVHISEHEVPSCIDELPILALCAACATGTSRFDGIAELAVKESDRITAIYRLLTGLGVAVQFGDNWMQIQGVGGVDRLAPLGRFDPGLDHRMAFCAAVAGLAGPWPLEVQSWSTTQSSWPDFASAIAAVSMAV